MHVCTAIDQAQYFQFDTKYLDDLKNGDIATTEHFFRYFRKAIAHSLGGRLPSAYMIEDIQQETFIRVLRAVQQPGNIRQPERFGAYVISVSWNILHECLRQRLH